MAGEEICVRLTQTTMALRKELLASTTRCGQLSWISFGWVAEWFKAHAWKVCLRQNRNVGSNPTPSVSLKALTALM